MDSLGTEDQTNLANIDFTSLTAKIDDALFKLERYWNTGSHEYVYFGFKKHFAPLLLERDNSKFNVQFYGIHIQGYWDVIHKISSSFHAKLISLENLCPNVDQFLNDIQEICDLHTEHTISTGPIYPYDEFALLPDEVSFLYLLKERPSIEFSASPKGVCFDKAALEWRTILLSALQEPEFSRVETWAIKQRKSEYSPLTFFKHLLNVWHHYNYEIIEANFYAEKEQNFEVTCWCNYSAQINDNFNGVVIDKNKLQVLYKNLQHLYRYLTLNEPGLLIFDSPSTTQSALSVKEDIKVNVSPDPKLNETLIFFEDIRNFRLGQIAIYNKVKVLTDNLSQLKLHLLFEDFDFYLSHEKHKKLNEFSHEDLQAAIFDFEDNGKEIPYIQFNDNEVDVNGSSVLTNQVPRSILDQEKLLFPKEFYHCNKFRDMLLGLIKDNIHKNSTEQPKLSLKDYKKKLDLALSYFDDFAKIVSAIKTDMEEDLIAAIIKLNAKNLDRIQNNRIITEQVHFDLDEKEIIKYYNYGLKRISEIIDWFNKVSLGTEVCFLDEDLNKKVHANWHKHGPRGEVLIILSFSPVGFIKLLFETMKKNLLEFQKRFTDSYSISVVTESFSSGKTGSQDNPELLVLIPKFKPEFVQNIFDLLKDFFEPTQQSKLEQVLITGNDSDEKLIFLDNGNRLADVFKQLIDSDIITGCKKNELENWIYRNFKYRKNREFTDFKLRYLQDIISTDQDKCQKPIINVIKDKATGKILISKA